MPLFSYACKTCETAFETLVRGEEIPVCPACGGKRLEQMLSRIAKPAAGGPDDAPACAAQNGAPSCGACPGMAGMCDAA
jgi:putative FmdB family regulatory protein